MAHTKSVALRTKGCGEDLPLREMAYRLRGILPIPLLLLSILWSYPQGMMAIAGTLLLTLGQLVRFWVSGYLGGLPVDKREGLSLVTWGPYALARHPRYWGNFLIGLGLSLVANWFVGYLLFAFYCFLSIKVLIPVEEELLASMYGEEFTAYQASTNRFFPTTGKWAAMKGEYSWRHGFESEKHMLLFLLSIGVCFTIKWLFLTNLA